MTNPAPSIYLADLTRTYLQEGPYVPTLVQRFEYGVYMGENLPVGQVGVTVFHPGMGCAADLLELVEEEGEQLIAAFFYSCEIGMLAWESGHDFGGRRELLFVRYIGVEDVFQGSDIGLQIVRALRARHGDMHLAIQAGALWEPGEEETEDQEAERVWRYWERLGFNASVPEFSLFWNNCAYRSEFEGEDPTPVHEEEEDLEAAHD
jgi:hypothetical protein